MKYILLSDIHANRVALDAVLKRAVSILVNDPDHGVIFLGDLVGYGSMEGALECIQWLRSQTDLSWIPGNHDEWMMHPVGKIHDSALLSLRVQRAYLSQPEHKKDFVWFEEQVTQAITQRPTLLFKEEHFLLCCTHASLVEGSERGSYLYPWISARVENELLRLANKYPGQSICLCYGHTHFPVLAGLYGSSIRFQTIRYGVPVTLPNTQTVINPGSIGQPRDGDPRASFAILDAEARTVTFHRVEYDVEELARQLEADGHFGSRFHRLSWDERDQLKKRTGRLIDPKAAYRELIQRLYGEIIDANLSNYRGVYRKMEGGLKSVNEYDG